MLTFFHLFQGFRQSYIRSGSFSSIPSICNQRSLHECSVFISRFGPRHIRAESPMVRKRNHATGAQPFDTLAVADIGDVGVCLYDIKFVPHFFPISSTYSRKRPWLMNLFYLKILHQNFRNFLNLPFFYHNFDLMVLGVRVVLL